MLTVSVLTLMVPALSAAGVTYAVLRSGAWTIYFQSELNASPYLMTSFAVFGDSSRPVISPDGRRVAFEVGGRILACPVDGKGECARIQGRNGPIVSPAWHPLSGELVFAEYTADGREEHAKILTTRKGLREVLPLLAQTGVQDEPTFSGDGRLLAYTVSQTVSLHSAGVQVVQQIWLVDMTTGVARQLLAGGSRDQNVAWAPSHRAIAFASDRSGDFEIWTIGVDGRGLRRVTSGPGAKTRPRWSPDGKSIMFTMAREGRLSLWIIDADGSNLRQFEPFGPNADVQLRDADWR